MTILQLALIGWGLLLATFVGFVIHGNRKYRAARDFNDHVVGVMAIINKPSCPECRYTYTGPLSDHTCPDGF